MDINHGERITPHLYRVAWWDIAQDHGVNCDTYAVDGGNSVVLIDSGRGGSSYTLLKENLIYWGLWDRLKVCMITHMHQDHAGGIKQLQSEGISVWGGRGAASFGEYNQAQEYYSGNVPEIDKELDDGETFVFDDINIQMLYTPGHSSTCVTYLTEIDSIKCAFAGDLVMPHGTIGYSGSFDFNKDQLLNSLSKLIECDFDALLTGHMLSSSQPEGFWMKDGRNHVLETLDAGLAGKWTLAPK